MSTSPSSKAPEAPSNSSPQVSMDSAVRAIGHPSRWKLLAELAEGEPLMISELAERVRRSVPNVSKQVAYLRRIGIVTVTRRLYHLSNRVVQLGNKEVDFGWFVARFGTKS